MAPLRIFISSPGDVNAERRRAALVIEKLAKDYSRFFEIEPILWETEPMLASGHFQDAIVAPSETDIVVLILWSRLGTPLPERTNTHEYRGIDGRAPVTGTEWEFESALAANLSKGVPDLLAYKKRTPPEARFHSAAELEEVGRQWQKLEAFWSRHFVDQGQFRAGFGTFDSLDAFEAKLESDLRRLIEHRAAAQSAEAAKAPAPTWLKGSPFRGLETYRFEHASIFFGRSEATKTAVEHLVENAEAGNPFLLVLGASGAGKSSLAQAGIVPALCTRGVVAGVGEWRRAVMRPGGHPAGPFAALAAALSSEDCLPELVAGQDVGALARHLEDAAANPNFPIVTALGQREKAARDHGRLLSYEGVNLVLVVDQLEELLTTADATPDQRKAFIACLQGLTRSGRLFVIATMRSDYWHRAVELPLLVTLAEGRGRLDLLPPTQAEIADLIRRSAEAAGLAFESDRRTEIRLDAALAEEAANQPGALPLLSFLLDALYAKDVAAAGGTVLTYSSVRSLGGLTGAIATRAETAFAGLPPDVQAALPKVLRALVTVGRSGAAPTARSAAMTSFAQRSPERRIVDVLLDPHIRLLVAEGDGENAHIRLAHEALIGHWARAQEIATRSADFFRIRVEAEDQQRRWEQNGRRAELLIPRGLPLIEAERLDAEFGEELAAGLRAFIAASGRRARMQQRLTAAAAIVFGLAFVAASTLGFMAYRSEQRAASNLNQAKLGQSRFLADQSRQKLAGGDGGTAILYALAGLPDTRDGVERPYSPQAEVALYAASRRVQEVALLAGHGGQVFRAVFSPDGKRVVTASADKTARIWDAETHRQIAVLAGHDGEVRSAAFSPDGRRIVTASRDKTARIWDAESHRQLAVLAGHEDQVNSVVFSPDGRSVMTASNDKTVRIWDAETHQEVAVLAHDNFVWSAAFSTDGNRIVTGCADKTARIWDAETRQQIAVLKGHTGVLWGAAFSPDGRRIVTASDDGTAMMWDAETHQQIAVLSGDDPEVWGAAFSPDGRMVVTAHTQKMRLWDAETHQQFGVIVGHEDRIYGAAFSPDGQYVLTASGDGTASILDLSAGWPIPWFTGHTDEVTSAAFGPDGRRVVTASKDKTARIWDAETLKQVAVLAGHENRVNLATFSLDGRRVVTASEDKTARIWDAETQQQIAVLAGHDGRVATAAFSPDGRRVVTASSDNTARIWDAETYRQIAVLKGHDAAVVSAAFSPDGRRVVTASYDMTVRIWDAETQQQVAVLVHDNWLWSAAFSPDGRRVVTTLVNGTPTIWDAETHLQIAILAGHDAQSAAFSPDGRRVVTASAGGTARIWNAETYQQIAVLGHTLAVRSAAFSPDGRRVVTAFSKTARMWDVFPTTQELVDYGKQIIVRCLTRAQREQVFLEPEPPAWCIEMTRWPYHTEEWKSWLAQKKAGQNPPLPNGSAQ